MAHKNINNVQAATTLNGTVAATTTTTAIVTDGSTGFPAVPFTATFGSEAILVTSIGSSTDWTVVRAFDGTAGSTHADEEAVEFKVLSQDYPWLYDNDSDSHFAVGDMAMDSHVLNFLGTDPADGESPKWDISGSNTVFTYATDANDGLFNGVGGLGGDLADGVTLDATQSSDLSGAVTAERALNIAIDITSGRSHTQSEANPWWQIIFTGAGVLVWNKFAIRAQDHSTAFSSVNFSIQGRNPITQAWTTYATNSSDPGQANWVSYSISGPTVDGIKIQSTDTDYLILGSVEAWGTWYPNGTGGSWQPVKVTTVSDTAPSTPSTGDIWVNPTVAQNNPNAFEGSWMQDLVLRPETAHVDDQEFSTDTADGTVVTTTGTTNWVQGRGRLSCKFDSIASNDIEARLWPLTPTTFPVTLDTAVILKSFDGNYPSIGLVFADGITSADDVVMFGLQKAGTAALYNFARSGTFTTLSTDLGSFSYASDGANLHTYIRLVWTAANTFKMEISWDGLNWVDHVRGSESVTLTPTYFGVAVTNWGDTDDSISTFEYVRVTESDLSSI